MVAIVRALRSISRRLPAPFLAVALLVPGAPLHLAAKPRTVCAPVLIYHHVKPIVPSDDAIERGLTVVPSVFKSQLMYLTKHHFHFVTVTQVVAAMRGVGSLPSKPVALTFDDGYADVYPDVFKLLRARHLTASFFIVPGFLNTPRYLTWKEVADMSRHGMDIEAHTMTHPDLALIGASQLWTELKESRDLLQSHLHKQIKIMAYPYGAYDAAVLAEVHKAGYVAAFTTAYGTCLGPRHLLTLPRIYANKRNAQPIGPQ